jgi:hypothetical protein
MDASVHRSVNYRAKALPRWIFRRVLRNEQAKLYEHFARSFSPRPDWRVLEVGTNGSLEEARDYFLHSLYPYPEQITAAGLEEGHSQFKGNADQLGVEVIGMLWEVGVGRFC